MNGSGEVIAYHSSKGETKELIKNELDIIKNRCKDDEMPEIIFTDNAGSHEASIKKVFPRAKVGQDLKHLINRPLEHCAKSHEHYSAFSIAFHGAFTDNPEVIQRSRSGKIVNVPGMLPGPDEIIRRAEIVISRFKALCSAGLFLKDFDHVWENQKEQIHLYIFEANILVEGILLLSNSG